MSENRRPASGGLPLPLVTLLRVLVVVLVGSLTLALISAIGLPGVLMLAGVLGSFAFVGLAAPAGARWAPTSSRLWSAFRAMSAER